MSNEPAAQPINLQCDVLSCPARLNTKITNVELACEYGRRKGWLCTGVGDFCPGHNSATASEAPIP